MLFRVLVIGTSRFGDLLEGSLSSESVAVERAEAGRFWLEPEQWLFDLAVVPHADLPTALQSAVKKVKQLPQRPEIAVWGAGLDDREVLSLQAAGIYAVVPTGLGEDQSTKVFDKLVSRRKDALAQVSRAREPLPSIRVTDLACKSPATRKVLKIAERVAISDTPLLLLGETGAGKEWLARAIHAQGPQSSGPFIAVNCGAIPENLLESELFGHEKGAFTGAVRARRGYFEQAHGGTLFLDEIGDMPSHLQVRLLRVLQDQVIQRLGAEETITVDTRVLAATHNDLKDAIENGHFRKDLFYRLAVVTLTVPPLRERVEDIPDLAQSFLEKTTLKLTRADIHSFSDEVLAAFAAYDWPGNVRELMNVIERAVLLCEHDPIGLEDLPIEIAEPVLRDRLGAEPAPSMGFEQWLDQPLEVGKEAVVTDFERHYFLHLLKRNRGHIGKTAAQAGIDPRTLYNKMQRLDLHKNDFKKASEA